MKRVLFLIFAFNTFFLFSQNHFYFDDELMDIDSVTYNKRCKNLMRKCYNVNKNDTLISVSYNRFNFGKLSPYSNKRIRKEIFRNNDFNGYIIIHYATHLKNYEEIKNIRKQRKKRYDSINYPRKLDIELDYNKIMIEGKKNAKRINKCIKKLENKFDLRIFHYYSEGKPEYTSDLNWIYDKNKIIKNYFFNFYSNYHYVIIKPDGEYIQIGSLITPNKIKRLLKKKDWHKFKKDLKESKLAKKPKGFFLMEHIHSCI